jgi:hypothetical protein
MNSNSAYGLSHGEPIVKMTKTEKFYKSVIDKVMDSTRHHFLANGVSEKVHERLKKVGCSSGGIYPTFDIDLQNFILLFYYFTLRFCCFYRHLLEDSKFAEQIY